MQFASIFLCIITRNLRGFPNHESRMRGENFVCLSFVIASNKVLLMFAPRCTFVGGEGEAGMQNFFWWFPPNEKTINSKGASMSLRKGQSIKLSVRCKAFSLLSALSHTELTGVNTHGFCNTVINWWTVGPRWLQELRVRHQCPEAIYVLCQWGASEYHMSQRLMSSLFLLMGMADTARLEISVPASEINSNRAS